MTVDALFKVFAVNFFCTCCKNSMNGAETPGNQLGHRSCPSSFGNSQVPKCPDLCPWPKLADAVSEGRLWSPNPALLGCFLHEKK